MTNRGIFQHNENEFFTSEKSFFGGMRHAEKICAQLTGKGINGVPHGAP